MTDPTASDDDATLSARTRLARALGRHDAVTKAVVPPLHVATTFLRDPDNGYSSGFVYGRPDNATVRHVEAVIASLEGAASALVFGSGMAALTAPVMALAPGDHVVAPQVMYWAFRQWLLIDAARMGIAVTLVDMTDPAAVAAALQPGRTKLVFAETPANPLWSVTDIAAVAALAHAAGALLVVDSTVATPVLSQPLALGADIVMHAATKYLNGHSDVVAGALAVRPGDAARTAFFQRVARVRATLGAILGPFEAYLLLRGLRTLDVRVRAQASAALTLATRLRAVPGVVEVLYPGLPDHPQHEVALRQMKGGFGGMLSVRVAGGAEAAIAAAARVRLWTRATSLGGVESLIEHRASIEGPDTPCPPDLLRLSVGLEDPDELLADLVAAIRG